MVRLGSSISVFDVAHLGSSLSLRTFSRFGSSMSVLGACRIGSTVSVLHGLLLGSGLHFSDTNTYIIYDAGSSELRFHAAGNKRMSLTATGGSLHGTWSSESIISASDRRLKHKVEPLYRALAGRMSPTSGPQDAPAATADLAAPDIGLSYDAAQAPAPKPPITLKTSQTQAGRAGAVDWLLRELRPVSFKFRDGHEAKSPRYGFVAQEIERVLPEMVRDKGENKYVVYQDMVAVLTLASQVQQERLASQEARAQTRNTRLGEQAQKMLKLQRSVAAMSARISRWESLARRSKRSPRAGSSA
jgi:hypothetical protein